MTLRALIAGYYGAGNAGDELILESLVAGLRRLEPGAMARVLSYDPEATRRAHGVESIGWEELGQLQESVRWSTLVIVGGGGLWQDYWGFDPLEFLGGRPGGIAGYGTPILLAHLLGKPSAILGAGVGPLREESSREAVRDLAQLAAFVSARDTASRHLLVECGVPPDHVHIGADLAFLQGPLQPHSLPALLSGSKPPVLGVSLRPWDGAGSGWQGEVIRALVVWQGLTGGSVLLVPLHESTIPVEDDRTLADRMARDMSETGGVRVAPAGLAPRERLGLLASADVVLAMRYHAVVAALQAGVPCVGLAYDSKVRSLMDEAAVGNQALSLDDLSASVLVEGLLRAAKRPPVDRTTIERLKARAEESLRVALLHSGADTAAPPEMLRDLVLGQARALTVLERGLQARLAPHAISGRRVEAGLQLVAEAEAALFRQQQRAEAAETRLAGLEVETQAVAADLERQIESERSRAAEAQRQLAALRSTAGVRILDRYWQWLRRSAPEGSTRRRIYSRVRGLIRVTEPGAGWRAGSLRRKNPDSWRVGRNTPTPSDEEWLAALSAFTRDPHERAGTLVLLASTRYQANEGQRSYHIANEFARLGWRVVFGYWRWGMDGSQPVASTQSVFELPLDVLLVDVDRALEFLRHEASLLLLEFPYPGFFRLVAAANARGMVTLYELVDDWRAFAQLGQAPWYDEKYEGSLGTATDVITAVSPELVRIAEERCGRRAQLIPNATGPGLGEVPLTAGPKTSVITMGYFGHLTEAWFDWDVVLQAASRRPDWRIEIIGYGGDWRTSRLPSNVHYLGKVPRASLATSTADWDVAIIPFREGDAARSADPIKAYEYLSLGLPVVVTGVDPPIGAEGLVLKTRGVDEFVQAVESAAMTRWTGVPDRLAYIAANTWERRVKDLLTNVEASTSRAVKRDLFQATR
jgi:polysaccharide pyruvyl transferase CsaB